MTFRSKVDLWLVALVIIPFGASLIACLVEGERGDPSTWVPTVILVAAMALIGALSIPTVYTLSGSDLVVRAGRMRWSIPLAAIRRVQPSRSLLSSPAWSLDRLAIHYGEGRKRSQMLISPADRGTFLTLLRERAQLTDDRGGLVRTDVL